MDGREQGRLVCAECGDPIGAYESLWWMQSDGALVHASSLQVRDDARHLEEGSRFFHAECLPSTDAPND
jgi:hypothetical protein